MSYSLNVQAPLPELGKAFNEAFDRAYPEAVPGIEVHAEAALDAVETLATGLEGEGAFSVSWFGHANQGEGDSEKDNMTLSIRAV